MAVSIDAFGCLWAVTSLIGALILLGYAIMFGSPWRKLRTQLKGPRCYPIVGTGLSFVGTTSEDVLNILGLFIKQYGLRFMTMFGPDVFVVVADKGGMEKVLSSPIHINKSYLYGKLFGNWLGDGLLLSSETAMGVKLNAQTHRDAPYLKAVHSLCEVMAYRGLRPWLYPNFLWKLTHSGRREAESVATIIGFSKSVIAKRKEERKTLRYHFSERPSVEDPEISLNPRKHTAFLDTLLDAQENGEQLTDDDIREEVDNIIFGGYDTAASSLIWTIMLLASHPEHQKKVHDELQEIFGTDKERDITSADISRMKYLDMCLKESLRLYPSAPGVGRKLCSELDLGDVVLPPGTNVVILPYFVHRNPDDFPDPEKFDPLRFTPENCVNRHPYAYIPFSAGPRSCMGQKFAQMEEKIMLANIFRNFRVELACDHRDIVVMPEFVLKPRDGLPVKLIPI